MAVDIADVPPSPLGSGGGGGAPSGAAGGSLGGTYPDPTVTALEGLKTQATGLLKSTITTGAFSRGVPGTDFQQVLSTLGRYFTTGQALAGLSATDCTYFWDDFMLGSPIYPPGTLNIVAAGGTGIADTSTSKGGVFRIHTSTTANSNVITYTARGQIGPPLTSRWYLAARAKIATATDAQTTCGVGLLNLAQSGMIVAGANGGNTTNFSVSYNSIYLGGSVLDLGLALDTAYHVFELWGLADNKLYARIDGGATVSVTLASPADSMAFAMIARNGTTAADRELDTDWMLVMGERN